MITEIDFNKSNEIVIRLLHVFFLISEQLYSGIENIDDGNHRQRDKIKESADKYLRQTIIALMLTISNKLSNVIFFFVKVFLIQCFIPNKHRKSVNIFRKHILFFSLFFSLKNKTKIELIRLNHRLNGHFVNYFFHHSMVITKTSHLCLTKCNIKRKKNRRSQLLLFSFQFATVEMKGNAFLCFVLNLAKKKNMQQSLTMKRKRKENKSATNSHWPTDKANTICKATRRRDFSFNSARFFSLFVCSFIKKKKLWNVQFICAVVVLWVHILNRLARTRIDWEKKLMMSTTTNMKK